MRSTHKYIRIDTHDGTRIQTILLHLSTKYKTEGINGSYFGLENLKLCLSIISTAMENQHHSKGDHTWPV